MLSSPALVRVSAIITSPFSTRIPTQYVTRASARSDLEQCAEWRCRLLTVAHGASPEENPSPAEAVNKGTMLSRDGDAGESLAVQRPFGRARFSMSDENCLSEGGTSGTGGTTRGNSCLRGNRQVGQGEPTPDHVKGCSPLFPFAVPPRSVISPSSSPCSPCPTSGKGADGTDSKLASTIRASHARVVIRSHWSAIASSYVLFTWP